MLDSSVAAGLSHHDVVTGQITNGDDEEHGVWRRARAGETVTHLSATYAKVWDVTGAQGSIAADVGRAVTAAAALSPPECDTPPEVDGRTRSAG
jgi:hypothetical protein